MKNILKIFILICGLTISALAQNKSVYTSLDAKNCKTIEQSNEGAGWYVGECKGIGGYKIEVTEGDIRQSINIITPAKKTFELNFSRVSSAFSNVGTKAEWRVKGKNPTALIVRFNASNPEDSTKNTSYLIVSKITPKSVCIVGVINPSKNQNAKAQKIADKAASMSCKTFD